LGRLQYEENGLTPDQAKQVQTDIERVLRKHGLWWEVKEIRRPDLKMIVFSDVSIKVTEAG
jgi:hypothetical protein